MDQGAAMSTKANKLLVQKMFEALGRGDRAPFLDALHDDLVMQVMGSSSWSQTVCGKRNFLDVFFGYVSSRLRARSPNTPLRYLADDDWVVVQARGNMTALESVGNTSSARRRPGGRRPPDVICQTWTRAAREPKPQRTERRAIRPCRLHAQGSAAIR